MSPEERKAWGEKMRLARQKSQEALKGSREAQPSPETTITEPSYTELLQRVQELSESQALLKAALLGKDKSVEPGNAQVERGSLIGSFEKYIVDPTHYPDPRERLAAEPRLERFAFTSNYELSWDISTTSYENIEGVRVREPRFTLELLGVMFDDDGNPTGRRYIARRAIFHEDPAAALAIARENKIPVDETTQKVFLDEMRYLRFRDWLFDFFYPPRPQTKKDRRQMVIGNQLVDTFEISSEDSQAMPFDELNTKFRG